MKRAICDEDHEIFRASVKEFLDREFWLAAGRQGFLHQEVPEEFGGSSAELVTAIGMTEPGGGSDLANLRPPPYATGTTGSSTAPRPSSPTAAAPSSPSTTCRVSSADLIGPLDTGFISMMQFLPQERLGSAVTDLAHARQILEETVQYAKDRKAFGQPIGSFQNTQFLLADLVTRIDVTPAYVDHCVQIHGGYGYMNEDRVARARRDARVTKIWAGSNEIMKMLIGRDLGL